MIFPNYTPTFFFLEDSLVLGSLLPIEAGIGIDMSNTGALNECISLSNRSQSVAKVMLN